MKKFSIKSDMQISCISVNPIFVCAGKNVRQPSSLPVGVFRSRCICSVILPKSMNRIVVLLINSHIFDVINYILDIP